MNMSSSFILAQGEFGIFSSEFAENQNSLFLFCVNTGTMLAIKRKK